MARGIITEEEKSRARTKYGMSKTCPHCGVSGDIDELFSWRRMRPGDLDVAPQAQCKSCRGRDKYR